MKPARWIPFLVLPLTACILVVSDGEWHGPWHPDRSVRGSGVQAEEHRTVAEFHAVDFEACGSVRVRVGEGPTVHLSGDDNLLALVETEVEGGVLTVSLAEPCSFRRGLEVVLGTPALARFTLEGVGDVRIAGLAAERLELAIEGAGTLQAQGSARGLAGTIEGSGALLLAELEAEEAELSIEGSGSMDVRVARSLHYSIAGSGQIRYSGAPELAGRIDGSGTVEKRP
jgi:hypothetical protein